MARTSTSRKNRELVEHDEPVNIILDDDCVRDTTEQRELDKRLVRGTFRFYERPNGKLQFISHRYPGDKYRTIVLKDGETYDLPFGVVRQLEEGAYYMSHNIEEAQGTNIGATSYGEAKIYTTTKGIARYAFIPAV